MKIKSIMVNSNNLSTLGKSNLSSNITECRSSFGSRLKNLSQERNIKKIIKSIESPAQSKGSPSLIKIICDAK
jgi:hypothetical protein